MEADGDLCGFAADLGADEIGAVDRHEPRFDVRRAARVLDRGFKSVIDLAAQEILQLTAVACANAVTIMS